jgi:hypothetical protein
MDKNLNYCATLVYPLMTKDKEEDLPAYILRILEKKHLSEPKVAQKTARKIKQTSVNDLKNGRVKPENAQIQTLYWLAVGMEEMPVLVFSKALGVSLKDLGVKDEGVMTELDYYLTHLPDRRLKDLLEIARAFAAMEEKREPPAGDAITLEEAIADNERKTGKGKVKK